MDRRQPVLVAGVVAALVAVSGSAGFTSTAADRGVEVAVVDDDEAFLGVERTTVNETDGTANLSVTVTNRFPAGTTLDTVEVAVDGNTETRTNVGTGVAVTVEFDSVDCDESLTVNAYGTGVEVSLDRPVDCN